MGSVRPLLGGWIEVHLEDYRRRTWEWEALPEFWTTTFPTQLPDEVYFDSWITRNGLSLRYGSGGPL